MLGAARDDVGIRSSQSPLYGIEGQGWFLGVHVFTSFVKVTFFRSTSLQPLPAGGTVRSKDARWIDIREDDNLDEAQWTNWVKLAAASPGWDPGSPEETANLDHKTSKQIVTNTLQTT